MIKMNYNYIILGSEWDLYRIIYSDLDQVSNAIYIPGYLPPKNTIKGILYRLHFNKRLNKILPLPGKHLWNSTYVKNQIKNEDKLCFVFFTNWFKLEKNGFIEYIKARYPNSKLVCFFQDLVVRQSWYNSENCNAIINKLKSDFDLLISYDQKDCEKFNMIYHHTVFSNINVHVNSSQSSDFFLLAKSKGRINEILAIFEFLKSKGFVCDFNIIGVPKNEMKYPNEIHYNRKMTYQENLEHVQNTKCLVEIMQEGAEGYSIRTNEAICLNKFLITNNKSIKNAPFYNPNYIQIFESSNPKISQEFLNNILINNKIEYNYKREYSPIEFLKFIDNILIS